MRHDLDLKSTHPWIDSTPFSSLSQANVLRDVLEKIRHAESLRIQRGGRTTKVVFDVDSTIFDVKPRTLRIMKEFALTPEARAISVRLCDWTLGLESHRLAYTLRESAEANSYPKDEARAEEFIKAMVPFWQKRFFSQEYLLVDRAMPGAVDFAWAVRDAGAMPVYLTGRDEPGMGRGTRTLLAHWGFPLENKQGELILKPYFGMDDAEFKDNALRELRASADVVALFDNEPANFHVFEKNFPDAMLVFLHSNCSRKEAKPVKMAHKIFDFSSSLTR